MRLDAAALARIREATAEVRAVLGEDDDERAVVDTVDSLTDAGDMLDALIRLSHEDAALEAAIRELAQRYGARARRIGERQATWRRLMRLVMGAMGVRTAERPGATLTVKPGSVSVRIVNAADVPTQLRKPGEPDKQAIRAQLEAGVDVPGAALERGEETLMVRGA